MVYKDKIGKTENCILAWIFHKWCNLDDTLPCVGILSMFVYLLILEIVNNIRMWCFLSLLVMHINIFLLYVDFTIWNELYLKCCHALIRWCYVSGIFQGPLFQQRPYPSPGAVLRKNAEVASQTKKSSSHFAPISKRGDGSDGLGDADWEIWAILVCFAYQITGVCMYSFR